MSLLSYWYKNIWDVNWKKKLVYIYFDKLMFWIYIYILIINFYGFNFWYYLLNFDVILMFLNIIEISVLVYGECLDIY